MWGLLLPKAKVDHTSLVPDGMYALVNSLTKVTYFFNHVYEIFVNIFSWRVGCIPFILCNCWYSKSAVLVSFNNPRLPGWQQWARSRFIRAVRRWMTWPATSQVTEESTQHSTMSLAFSLYSNLYSNLHCRPYNKKWEGSREDTGQGF